MKRNRKSVVSALIGMASFFGWVPVVSAVTHYVNLNNPTPSAPYTSWATAATNIQAAVNMAVDGDTVLIADGTYQITSEIMVDKDITIQGLNGPEHVNIKGNSGGSRVRCFNLGTNACVLDGLTISDGMQGVYCENMVPLVKNCIILNNWSQSLWGTGAGIHRGTICSSIIKGNIHDQNGGQYDQYDICGGAYQSNCHNCLFLSNIARFVGMGSHGAAGGLYGGTAVNCTIVDNWLWSFSGFFDGGGARAATLFNCIIAGSSCRVDYEMGWDDYPSKLANCTTYNSCDPDLINGVDGNITASPEFAGSGDYSLSSNSPCIERGSNSYVEMAYDLNGNPRIWAGVVDMGAYEKNSKGLSVSMARLSVTSPVGITPASRNIEIWSSESLVMMNYTISTNVLWLSVSPSSGSSTGEHDFVTVSFDTAGLAAGSHTGIIIVASAEAANSPQTITVLLDVYQPPPTIESSQTTVTIPVLYGTRPANREIEVWNGETNTVMNYTVAVNQPWMAASPESGASTGEHDSLVIQCYSEELAVGIHTGKITITSAEASNSPKVIDVVLDVQQISLLCSPGSMNLSAVLSNNPPAQMLKVASSARGLPMNYTITSDAGWLTASPTNDVSNGETNTVTVSVNSAALAEGAYVGHLILSAPDALNSPQTVVVHLNVHRPYVYLDALLELDDWVTPAGSEFPWSKNSGGTPSSGTGPSGAVAGNYYRYTEASYANNPYKTALLEKSFNFTGILEPELLFAYHMYGSSMGTLSVDVYSGTWSSNLWTMSGQKQISSEAAWSNGVVNLSTYGNQTNVTIRFRGTTGNGPLSDMAIDDVKIFNNALSSYGSGDIDQDGVLDSWEEEYLGAVLNCDPNADVDGDGQNNQQESIAGMNPTNAASCFAITNTVKTGSGYIIRWPSVSGRVYNVQWAAALTNEFQSLGSNLVYPQGSYTDTVHSADGKGFYNVDVRLNP